MTFSIFTEQYGLYQEETGLTELRYEQFLAQDTRDMRDCGRDELQYRWFFHLSVQGPTEET